MVTLNQNLDNNFSSFSYSSKMLNACSFAYMMMYSLEFSQTDVPPALNPYNLSSLPLDNSLQEWQRKIFSNIYTENISWDAAGVSLMPLKLVEQFGENAVSFHFGKTSCEELDCFGFKNLNGDTCTINDVAQTITLLTPGGPIRACRPSCFNILSKNVSYDISHLPSSRNFYDKKPSWKRDAKSKNTIQNSVSTVPLEHNVQNEKRSALYEKQIPSNEYVYFDINKNVCRLGIAAFRKMCVLPSTRGKDMNNVPSLLWSDERQQCSLTRSYCEAMAGTSFDNGDCILSAGQKALEIFFGTSLVRSLKLLGRNVDTETQQEGNDALTARIFAEKNLALKKLQKVNNLVTNSRRDRQSKSRIQKKAQQLQFVLSNKYKPFLIAPLINENHLLSGVVSSISTETRWRAEALQERLTVNNRKQQGLSIQDDNFISRKETMKNASQDDKSKNNSTKGTMTLAAGILEAVGAMIGVSIARYAGKVAFQAAAREMSSFSLSIVGSTLLRETVDRGVVRLGTYLAAKAVGAACAEAASATLGVIAAAMNPIGLAVEGLMVLSAIWDAIDPRFKHILRKEDMLKTRDAFIKNWNAVRGFTETGQPTTRIINSNLSVQNSFTDNSNKLGVIELTPIHVYLRMFGSFLDRTSPRFSSKRVHTFMFFVRMYCDAFDLKESDLNNLEENNQSLDGETNSKLCSHETLHCSNALFPKNDRHNNSFGFSHINAIGALSTKFQKSFMRSGANVLNLVNKQIQAEEKLLPRSMPISLISTSIIALCVSIFSTLLIFVNSSNSGLSITSPLENNDALVSSFPKTVSNKYSCKGSQSLVTKEGHAKKIERTNGRDSLRYHGNTHRSLFSPESDVSVQCDKSKSINSITISDSIWGKFIIITAWITAGLVIGIVFICCLRRLKIIENNTLLFSTDSVDDRLQNNMASKVA